jgi:hypothetical protein
VNRRSTRCWPAGRSDLELVEVGEQASLARSVGLGPVPSPP